MTGARSTGGAVSYEDLGPYSDWVDRVRRDKSRRPGWMDETPRRPEELRALACDILGPVDGETRPLGARVEASWRDDEAGVSGELVTWDLGYGPRTEAYVLWPSSGDGPWPGVVALHCHGGFTYYGKEKVADGPAGHDPVLDPVRRELYGGRAYANALARQGVVVLVHDVFTWGSRRFVLAGAPAGSARADEVARYNAAASVHEHVVEKYCRLLGTTFAAVVAHEDRTALAYLGSRPEVATGRIGCIGLSGGGIRAAMLQATSDVAATVVVAMMSTYEGMLDRHVASHTWMLYPERWPTCGDWPDLVACRPSSPLLVQYQRGDRLFSAEGMRDAHRRIAAVYAGTGNAGGYEAQHYDGPHCFDVSMQEAAFAWLRAALDRA